MTKKTILRHNCLLYKYLQLNDLYTPTSVQISMQNGIYH